MTTTADGGRGTVVRPAEPLDLRRTLGPLRRGPGDPTLQVAQDGALWRTTRTPQGPATLWLRQQAGEVQAHAWGEGAAWALEQLPELLGLRDDPTGFEPRHPLLVEAARRHPGLRLLRTTRVLEALVPAVLEQKVTGKEAFAAHRTLVRAHGTPAPGPAPRGMAVPPDAAGWLAVPSWDWHRAGVDPRRARTALAACRVAARLEEATGLGPDAATVRLQAVPGVGPWTAAEVTQRALGDPDHVSVGDFHLAGAVGWALAGRPVDDAGMLALLEPWRGHRQRVVRLLELAGPGKPRFGPRLTIQDHRAH